MVRGYLYLHFSLNNGVNEEVLTKLGTAYHKADLETIGVDVKLFARVINALGFHVNCTNLQYMAKELGYESSVVEKLKPHMIQENPNLEAAETKLIEFKQKIFKEFRAGFFLEQKHKALRWATLGMVSGTFLATPLLPYIGSAAYLIGAVIGLFGSYAVIVEKILGKIGKQKIEEQRNSSRIKIEGFYITIVEDFHSLVTQVAPLAKVPQDLHDFSVKTQQFADDQSRGNNTTDPRREELRGQPALGQHTSNLHRRRCSEGRKEARNLV